MTDPLSVAALSRTAPRVKFRPAQFHIVASQLPCVGRKLRPQQAWVHSVGNRGCIYWPFSGPSEPPCRTAAIDRSGTICAARGRSGSSVTADKPVRVKAAGSGAWGAGRPIPRPRLSRPPWSFNPAPPATTLEKSLRLPRTQIRAYRWCSPPRIGCAIMSPNRSIGRVQGASLPSERCVRTSL
jgi:hypothetical protein